MWLEEALDMVAGDMLAQRTRIRVVEKLSKKL
jgi:hypothetical protein